jgi:hypothetical protein
MLGGLRQLTCPLVLVAVLGTTWCFAWARSVNDRSARGYWPALDPDLMRRVMAADRDDDVQPPAIEPTPD